MSFVWRTPTQGVGGGGGAPPFAPTDLSGLRVWLDASQLALADGASVGVWQDRSGNAINPVVVASPAPKYRANALKGKGVVRIAFGQGYYCWASALGNPTGMDQDSTVAYVSRIVGTAADRVLTGLNDFGSNWFFGYWNAVEDVAHNGVGFMSPDPRPAWTTNWHLYTVATHSTPDTRQKMYKSGTLFNQGGPGGHGWKNTMSLSHYVSNATANCDCEIAELVAYNRELLDAERQQLETYLTGKWL